MKNLTIIIKPTLDCNLNCTYCYNYNVKKNTLNRLSLEQFEDCMQKLVISYNKVHFLWHGGEPLIMGKAFYHDIFDIQSKYSDRIQISNSLQTNGILLTEDFYTLFQNNQVKVNISFDGIDNEVSRGNTFITMNAIKLLEKYENKAAVLKVVLKSDLSKTKELYNYFKAYNLSVQLNPLFQNGCIDTKKILEPVEYSQFLIDLFLLWIDDEVCNIKIEPLMEYILMYYGKKSRLCTNNSCMTSFLSINPNGDIFPCSRNYTNDFIIGNLKNIRKFDDCYSSKSFLLLLNSSVKRRSKCMQSCELYPYCLGGCNHNALICGKIEDMDFFYCKYFKLIFNYISSYLKKLKINEIKNSIIRREIENNLLFL